jgi:hypothetical protein
VYEFCNFLAGEEINKDLQLSLIEGSSNQRTEYEDGAVAPSDSIRNDSQNTSATNNKHESSPSEEMQCRICRFRTSYKSVMIFHLRQHMKDSYWCDFCNTALPKGTVDLMKIHGADHTTGIDHNDQPTIANMQDDVVEQEAEAADNAVREENVPDSSTSPNSMDVMITVLPVSAEDVGKVVIKPETIKPRRRTEETIRLPNDDNTGCQGGQGSPRSVAPSEEEENDDNKNSSSLNEMQSICNRGKCIRVLNEMGMIIMQEVVSSNEVKDEGTVVSEEHTDSHIPSTYTNNCNTLDLIAEPHRGDRSKDQNILNQYVVDSDSRKDSAVTELEFNMEHSQFSVLNEMGIIEVASIESTEELQIGNLNSDVNEMRVNVTPGMMTYSNNVRRLNPSHVDNPCELNGEVLGVQN